MAEKRGRPLKLTPETTEKVVQGILAGVSLALASEAAGIANSTRMYWEKRGRAEQQRLLNGDRARPAEKIYLDFLEATTRARARSLVRLTTQISLAAKRDWRAAAWMAERRFPEEYSNQVALRASDEGPAVIRVVYDDGIDPALKQTEGFVEGHPDEAEKASDD